LDVINGREPALPDGGARRERREAAAMRDISRLSLSVQPSPAMGGWSVTHRASATVVYGKDPVELVERIATRVDEIEVLKRAEAATGAECVRQLERLIPHRPPASADQ